MSALTSPSLTSLSLLNRLVLVLKQQVPSFSHTEVSLDELSPVPIDEEDVSSVGRLYVRLIGVSDERKVMVSSGSEKAMMSSGSEKALLPVENTEKASLKESIERVPPKENKTIPIQAESQSSANSNPPPSLEKVKETTYKRPFSVFTNDSIDLEPLIISGVSFLSVPDR